MLTSVARSLPAAASSLLFGIELLLSARPRTPYAPFLLADGYINRAPISQGGKLTGVAHRFDWLDRLTSRAEILINGLQSRLPAVLDSHQLGGHIPVIEFSAFWTSLFKPNLIGPFADALFDVTHQAYLAAYSSLAGTFAKDIKGCTTLVASQKAQAASLD